jgi:hypothetical protein
MGELVKLAIRQEDDSTVAQWDALGLIFRWVPPLLSRACRFFMLSLTCRFGGVAAAVSTYLCWKMTRERERGARRIRGPG